MASAEDHINTHDHAGRRPMPGTAQDSLNTSDHAGRALNIVADIIGVGAVSATINARAARAVGFSPSATVLVGGASHGTSATTGSLTVAGIASHEAFGTPHIDVARRPWFMPQRELTGGEWALIALLAERITDIAIKDYGATPTEALGVTIIALCVIATMLSRVPRIL